MRNRLSKAEFSKIFLRPAIYFMTAFLVLALIIITFTYSPSQSRADSKVTFSGINHTVSDIFALFNDAGSSDSNSKIKLDDKLNKAEIYVSNFAKADSAHTKILNDLTAINNGLTTNTVGEFYNNLLYLANNQTNQTAKANFINSSSELKTNLSNILTFLETGLNSQTIDFYLTKQTLNELVKNIDNFYNFIPNNSTLNQYTTTELIDFGNKIISDYNLTNQIKKVQSLNKIEISSEATSKIVEEYYNKISSSQPESILSTKYAEIELYVSENSQSTAKEDINYLNKLFSQYKNITLIAESLLVNSLQVEKIGNYSNKEIVNYIGFEEYNSYNINENLTLNKYLLDNKIFDGNYLLNFNFNQIGGHSPTAFDFTVYAMQILSIIITIFCIFFMVSSVAGDQSNGTMKMIAMRPLTRNQILNGKIFACIKFLITFLIIAFVASFAVGYAMNGLGEIFNTILIFNSTRVFELPSYLVILIYLASLFLNILFYIFLSLFLAIIFKNSSFAIFSTFVLYCLGIIVNATSSGAAWFAFTPYACLDLFKFFGNSSAANTFLGINMLIDGSFYLAIIGLIVMCAIFVACSKIIFKRRDI